MHITLLATVASIAFSNEIDAANAEFARRLATEVQIPDDQIENVLGVIDNKLADAGDGSDNAYFAQTYQSLEAARAGAQWQFDRYQEKLAAAQTDAIERLKGVGTTMRAAADADTIEQLGAGQQERVGDGKTDEIELPGADPAAVSDEPKVDTVVAAGVLGQLNSGTGHRVEA